MPTTWNRSPEEFHKIYLANTDAFYRIGSNTLAKELDIPADAFAATMEKWNGYVADKNDPDFGRTSFANPLDTAPFYAVKVTAGIHHTMGGIKIDTDAEVISTDGSVIPGLFAAGETTGGVHGGRLVAAGAPEDIRACEDSVTGRYL